MKMLVALLPLLAACSGEGRPRSTTSPLRVPVTAHLVVTDSAPGRAELAVRVERHVTFAADVAVHVTVPAGVVVVGPTDWVSPAGAAGVDERTLDVRFDAVPATDLELTATVESRGFGLTARDTYRFGRPAPEAAPRARVEGPHLVTGGADLGPSVPLGN